MCTVDETVSVEMIVSAEDDVDAVLVVDWVDLLRGGGRCGQGLRELDVLHGNWS